MNTDRKVIEFVVPGEVRGKMRPKASAFSGHARMYTPAKQVEYENWVKLCYFKETKTKEPIFRRGTPIAIEILVKMAVPKSVSKKKRDLMLKGNILPETKPDVDNAAKSILDALNGLAYDDDAMVTMLTIAKVYSTDSLAYVKIWEDTDDKKEDRYLEEYTKNGVLTES